MIVEIYDCRETWVGKRAGLIRALPECGNYCDSCGDCLACSGNMYCYGTFSDGKHRWVEYYPGSSLFVVSK